MTPDSKTETPQRVGSVAPLFGEFFAKDEVTMDSPKLAWMKRHGIITWYDSGMRDGFRACPAEWFAGFQAWWPDKSGIDFFAVETAHNGDSRIGEGDSEDEALANLMTCWDARKIGMRLWHEESSPNNEFRGARRETPDVER